MLLSLAWPRESNQRHLSLRSLPDSGLPNLAVAPATPGESSCRRRQRDGISCPVGPGRYFSLRRQRKVTKRKATRWLARCAGSLRFSAFHALAKLADPWGQTPWVSSDNARFTVKRLRCSAAPTGLREAAEIPLPSPSIASRPGRSAHMSEPCAVTRTASLCARPVWRETQGTRRRRAGAQGALLFGYFLLGTQEKVTNTRIEDGRG
jgi:hypothetical protein